MDDLTKILVTGGGAPGAPGILHSIKNGNPNIVLYSCDVQEHTVGKLIADRYFTVPMGTDPNYAQRLLEIATSEGFSTILPITTRELIPLSEHKELFAQNGIDVIVSDYKQLQIANDKGKLYTHLRSLGIPTPRFEVASNYEEYTLAKKYFKDRDEKFIIKPCVANGSRGFRIIDNSISKNDLLFKHKPTSTYISEEELDIVLRDGFPPIVVSEYLPGQEYTVDCLMQNGEIKFIIPRTREKMNNGISVAGTIEKNNDVIAYCQKILSSLTLEGPVGIQVKYSKESQPLLVEINPRIQGTTVACNGAGVNISLLAVLPDYPSSVTQDTVKWNTKFIRHYNELYY